MKEIQKKKNRKESRYSVAGFKREKHKFYGFSDMENQSNKKMTSSKMLKMLNKIKDGIIEEENDFNDNNNSNISNKDNDDDGGHAKTIKSVKTFSKKHKSTKNF